MLLGFLVELINSTMTKKIIMLPWLFTLVFCCWECSPGRYESAILPKVEEAHEPIPLKGYDGRELSIDSKEPYSPEKTCGECHEYDMITNGYHFQQGRTDGLGRIVISDNFNPKKPWHKSAGMFGKR